MHEMGKRFSGGERQQVAFARTLMQEAPIIVLDEPTIGLDPKTELSLIETMFFCNGRKDSNLDYAPSCRNGAC